MAYVAVDDLEAGMVLSQDAAGANGQVIAPKGAELTDRHIRLFKTWGITGVDIAGADQEDEDSPIELDDAQTKELRLYIENRMRLNQEDTPVIHKVKAMLSRHLSRKRFGKANSS